jgi:hypothetical protein
MLNFTLRGSSAITSVKTFKIHSMNHDWTAVEIQQLLHKYPKLEKLRIYLQYSDVVHMRNWFEQVSRYGTMMKRLSIGLFVPVDSKVIPAEKAIRRSDICDGTINLF